MALTVESSFTKFYEAINLDGDKREIANARRDRIKELLAKHFDILEAFASGSIPRFTALKDHSDLDVIVALHYGKHIDGKTPSQVLQSVRNALAEYRTNVRKNGQAVTLHYDTWPNVDVVPVSRTADGDKILHYNVPNENTGTWIKSKPKTHTSNIEAKTSECGINFRWIIKMVKWWNLIHSDYLQSYHIEILAMRVFDGNIDDTPWNVFQFFQKARPLLEGPLWHDIGYVDEYLSASDRVEVLKRFDTAIEKSRQAWYYGKDELDIPKAIRYWKQVFGDKFPTYG